MANLIIGNKSNSGAAGYDLLLDATLKIKDPSQSGSLSEVDLVSDSIPAADSTIDDIQHSQAASVAAVCAAIPAWARAAQKPTYTASEVGAVPTSRTVNGKALSSNITLTAANVGAVPTSRTINDQSLNANIVLDAADVGAVPTTRTVNGQSLNSDVTLNATNIPATTPQGLSGENTQELLTEIAAKLNQGIQYNILKSVWGVSGTNIIYNDVPWQNYDILIFGVQHYGNRLSSTVMSVAWFRTTTGEKRPYAQANVLASPNGLITYQMIQNGNGSIKIHHGGTDAGSEYGFYVDGIKF